MLFRSTKRGSGRNFLFFLNHKRKQKGRQFSNTSVTTLSLPSVFPFPKLRGERVFHSVTFPSQAAQLQCISPCSVFHLRYGFPTHTHRHLVSAQTTLTHTHQNLQSQLLTAVAVALCFSTFRKNLRKGDLHMRCSTFF